MAQVFWITIILADNMGDYVTRVAYLKRFKFWFKEIVIIYSSSCHFKTVWLNFFNYFFFPIAVTGVWGFDSLMLITKNETLKLDINCFIQMIESELEKQIGTIHEWIVQNGFVSWITWLTPKYLTK